MSQRRILVVAACSILLGVTAWVGSNWRPFQFAWKLFGDLTGANASRYEAVRDALRHVQLGMTTDEVREIAGPPERVSKSGRHETWIYPAVLAAAQNPKCVFDTSTGRVVMVIVSDGERRGGMAL